MNLGGLTTGYSISIETEQGPYRQVSLDDYAIRHITGKNTSGTAISLSDFYGKYYRALTASATTYTTYAPYSQQGGTANGAEALSGPAPGKEDGGYRAGSRYFPVDGTYGTFSTNYCYTLNLNDTTALSTLRGLFTGSYASMFSNVSAVQSAGGNTYFTATLHTGYYFNVLDAVNTVRSYLRPNVTYTFTVGPAGNGIYSDNSWTYAGSIYFYGYLAEGMVFTNTTGAPGTISMFWSFGGVCKVSYAQIKLDTGAASTTVLTTNVSVSGSYTNLSLAAGASVIMQTYWWGAGPSFTNSSYINSGSWQVGALYNPI